MKNDEEYDTVSSLCTDEMGGEVADMTMVASFKYFHRTYFKYPYCKSNLCTVDDIAKQYDFISYMFSGGTTTDKEEFIHFALDDDNSCDEIASEKAFIKKKPNGSVFAKSCKWLHKRPSALKKDKICSKSLSMDGYQPAKEVCPATCCTCEEKDKNTFLKKDQMDWDTGLMKISKKTCRWLRKTSAQAREFQCGKSTSSYIGGLPPARISCPQTCGVCNTD